METTRMFGVALALAAVLWLLCLAVPPAAWAAEPTTTPTSQPTSASAKPVVDPRVGAWIVRLGAETVTEREQASRELAKIGLPAMPALHDALESSDPEIAARARLLLTRIPQDAIADDACLRWKTQLPDGRNWGLILADDAVIFHGSDDKLHALSQADGKQKWERTWETQPEDFRYKTPTLTLAGGKLICHRDEAANYIQALDPATGDELWQSSIRHAMIRADGDVIVGLGTVEEKKSRWCGVSVKDGSTTWIMDSTEVLGPHCRGQYVKAFSRDLYLIAIMNKDGGRTMVAVDPATGKKMWDTPMEEGPSATVTGGKLYVTETELPHRPQRTVAYDLKTGQTTTLDLAKLTALGGGGRPQVFGNYLLYGRWESIAAYDLTSGKELWYYALPRNDVVRQDHWAAIRAGIGFNRTLGIMTEDLPTATHDGAAVFSRGDALLAIDLATGAPRWKHPVNGLITWGPVVQDGVAYIIVHDITNAVDVKTAPCHLYALDLSKASLLGPPKDEIVETGQSEKKDE